MSKTTTATPTALLEAPLETEVLEFPANFEDCSPLDELVRTGARRMVEQVTCEVSVSVRTH